MLGHLLRTSLSRAATPLADIRGLDLHETLGGDQQVADRRDNFFFQIAIHARKRNGADPSGNLREVGRRENAVQRAKNAAF